MYYGQDARKCSSVPCVRLVMTGGARAPVIVSSHEYSKGTNLEILTSSSSNAPRLAPSPRLP